MRNKRTLVLITTAIAVAVVASFFKYRLVNWPHASGSSHVTVSNLQHTPVATPTGKAASSESGSTDLEPVLVGHSAALPVSPYAVVSTGICVPGDSPGREEASRKKWETLLTDPFWQSIFLGVDPEKFSLVRTEVPMQRYVTYWKKQEGQLIHWTGKRITIPAGTRILTDGHGKMFLCACGNQVVAVLPPGVPEKPGMILPPEEEPPVAYLVPEDPDLFPLTSVGPPSVLPLTPLPLPELAMVPPVSGPLPAAGLSSGMVPSVIPPVVPPINFAGKPAPMASVPEEPGTLYLTLLGLGAIFFALRHCKQK